MMRNKRTGIIVAPEAVCKQRGGTGLRRCPQSSEQELSQVNRTRARMGGIFSPFLRKLQRWMCCGTPSPSAADAENWASGQPVSNALTCEAAADAVKLQAEEAAAEEERQAEAQAAKAKEEADEEEKAQPEAQLVADPEAKLRQEAAAADVEAAEKVRQAEEQAARLKAAKLKAARLKAARLKAARIKAAKLKAAKLKAAKLKAAKLKAAKLKAAKLKAAKLKAAKLKLMAEEQAAQQVEEDYQPQLANQESGFDLSVRLAAEDLACLDLGVGGNAIVCIEEVTAQSEASAQQVEAADHNAESSLEPCTEGVHADEAAVPATHDDLQSRDDANTQDNRTALSTGRRPLAELPSLQHGTRLNLKKLAVFHKWRQAASCGSKIPEAVHVSSEHAPGDVTAGPAYDVVGSDTAPSRLQAEVPIAAPVLVAVSAQAAAAPPAPPAPLPVALGPPMDPLTRSAYSAPLTMGFPLRQPTSTMWVDAAQCAAPLCASSPACYAAGSIQGFFGQGTGMFGSLHQLYLRSCPELAPKRLINSLGAVRRPLFRSSPAVLLRASGDRRSAYRLGARLPNSRDATPAVNAPGMREEFCTCPTLLHGASPHWPGTYWLGTSLPGDPAWVRGPALQALGAWVATIPAANVVRTGIHLGEGAFGAVERVYMLGSSTPLALKTLKPGVGRAAQEQFVDEIELLAGMNNQNIIGFVGAVVSTGHRPQVLGHLTHLANLGSLTDFLATYNAPRRGLLSLAIDVAEGVKYLHSRGFAHLDLKSDNILVHHNPCSGQVAKLADLGLALGGFSEPGQAVSIGHFRGTYAYAAPEMLLDNENVTTAADTWSLGCVLMDILSGYPYYTFQALPQDAEESKEFHMRGRVPVIPDTDPGVGEVIKGCLRPRPEDRLPLPIVIRMLKQLLDSTPE